MSLNKQKFLVASPAVTLDIPLWDCSLTYRTHSLLVSIQASVCSLKPVVTIEQSVITHIHPRTLVPVLPWGQPPELEPRGQRQRGFLPDATAS